MATIKSQIERIKSAKTDIVSALSPVGVSIPEGTSISQLPLLASELVSDVDMLNASGLMFGSNSALSQADAPTCPELVTPTSDPATIGGQCDRISVARDNLITVLNTKGITIPSGTLIDGIAEYASKIRSAANIPNAQNKYFGSSDDSNAIVGTAIVGRAIVGMS